MESIRNVIGRVLDLAGKKGVHPLVVEEGIEFSVIRAKALAELEAGDMGG